MAIGRALVDLAQVVKAYEAWFQAAHHAAAGTGFAGDHAVLYDEAYTAAGPEFDGLLERAIGLSGDGALAAPGAILRAAAGQLDSWPSPVGRPEATAAGGAVVNAALVAAIQATTETLRGAGELTQGVDNMLAGLADAHEAIGYKLRARSGDMKKGFTIAQPFASSAGSTRSAEWCSAGSLRCAPRWRSSGRAEAGLAPSSRSKGRPPCST